MDMRTSRHSIVPSIPLRRTQLEEVTRYLHRQNFAIASTTGVVDAYRRTNPEAIGILKDEPPKPAYTSLLQFLLSGQPRREFIGILWFHSPIRGTDARTWVFDVYGEENLKTFQQMAPEIRRLFDRKIKCNLVDEKSRLEDFV